MESLVVWLITAVALGTAELLTGTLAPGLTAVAAAAAAALGAAGSGVPVQTAAFAVAAAVCLGLRPVALHHIRRLPPLRNWHVRLDRPERRNVQDVSASGGRVRIGGTGWPSRSHDGILVSPAGNNVAVIEIDGATAPVYPRE